jgi:hypothetical protein
MAHAAIDDVKGACVAKRDLAYVDRSYIGGAVVVCAPMVEYDPPRRIPDAKGTISSSRLRELAKKHQPPREWYEGDEEQVF